MEIVDTGIKNERILLYKYGILKLFWIMKSSKRGDVLESLWKQYCISSNRWK